MGSHDLISLAFWLLFVPLAACQVAEAIMAYRRRRAAAPPAGASPGAGEG